MMGFMPIAEELSEGLNRHADNSSFVLSPTFQTVLFCGENLFFANQGRFFAFRTFTWYHYFNRNWSGCGSPEARGQVRSRLPTL